MNFRNLINRNVTCEIHSNGGVQCFAKLANGNWVAVLDGNLDSIEISATDFVSMLETVVEVSGSEVRFTNHSAV